MFLISKNASLCYDYFQLFHLPTNNGYLSKLFFVAIVIENLIRGGDASVIVTTFLKFF